MTYRRQHSLNESSDGELRYGGVRTGGGNGGRGGNVQLNSGPSSSPLWRRFSLVDLSLYRYSASLARSQESFPRCKDLGSGHVGDTEATTQRPWCVAVLGNCMSNTGGERCGLSNLTIGRRMQCKLLRPACCIEEQDRPTMRPTLAGPTPSDNTATQWHRGRNLSDDLHFLRSGLRPPPGRSWRIRGHSHM